MKKSLVILFAATIGLVACNTEKKGPGGMKYTIHSTDGKEKIKEGDVIEVSFIQKNDKDSILTSSYDREQPQIFPVAKKMYAGDMNDVLVYFAEGDSVTFKIDLDTMAFYSKQPKPVGTKDKYMTFSVKINKVFRKNKGEVDSLFQKRANVFFQEEFKAVTEKKKNSEEAKIKKYIADNNLKTTTTASGLQYVITAKGGDQKPALGDTAMVDYVGKFTFKKTDGNDNVFDTSIEAVAKKTMPKNPNAQYAPRPIQLNPQAVAPGFVEAMQLIGVGGKITAIMPSKIGFGPQGGGPIGPYSPLVFEIELKSFKKGVIAPPAVVAPVTAAPTTKK